MPKLWFDVEDLFDYVRENSRPSGIQRLAFEVYAALQARPDAETFVRFIRHNLDHNSFRVVPWSDVAALFANLASAEPPSADASLQHPASKHFQWLPSSLQTLATRVAAAQGEATHAWLDLVAAIGYGVRTRMVNLIPFRRQTTDDTSERGDLKVDVKAARAKAEQAITINHDPFEDKAVAGDVIVALGSPWSFPDYALLVQAQQERGLKFALLVYDLIPLRRPEWCDSSLVAVFQNWFSNTLHVCDQVFAISQATADDIAAFVKEQGITLRRPVLKLPIGTGFGTSEPVAWARAENFPAPGSYALIVSTIEARKNHLLLFRVWRRMLEQMPFDEVPALVFAGRVGWLVSDLMQQIVNTKNLNGKLMVFENLTDAEVAALYEGCLFTLFPSFLEGWGLPITESLAKGKPCLTSNHKSLAEAGANLTRTFDPDNLHDAYRVIMETIHDKSGLVAWETQIRRDFRSVSWARAAQTIMDSLVLEHEPVIG